MTVKWVVFTQKLRKVKVLLLKRTVHRQSCAASVPPLCESGLYVCVCHIMTVTSIGVNKHKGQESWVVAISHQQRAVSCVTLCQAHTHTHTHTHTMLH